MARLKKLIINSTVPPFNSNTNEGCWKLATFRSSERTGGKLLIVETAYHSDEVRAALIEEFTDDISVCYGIEKGDLEVLTGPGYYTETILGKTFKISPRSFFQVNTPAAEILYGIVRDLVKDADILLDICCGTGTIGICVSDAVRRIIGLEIVESAVEDARENAALNGV
jgi:tRNA/tmRNA/rRNA uracil-C5-methylase (TrmA/RlmC/RlmD family)